MITSNMVFKHIENEKNERIRIVDVIGEYAFYVNIDSVSSMPTKTLLTAIEEELEGLKLVAIHDPFATAISDKDLSEVQIKKREDNWDFIQTYWFPNKDELLEKKNREKKLKEIVELSGFSMAKVKILFSRYLQRGMNRNALLPDYYKSGGKGKDKKLTDRKVGKPNIASYAGKKGINVTDEVKKHFEIAINKHYRNMKKPYLMEAYTNMLNDFYSDPYKDGDKIRYIVWDDSRIPTYHQFRYWFKKWEDPKKDITFRDGPKKFNLKERSLLGNSTIETDGPGTRFQIDATIADVYLVSSSNRNMVIGRPVIYAVIDVYSRLVTGIYAGLEGPSWLGAMMALDNMLTDKVKFCKSYGIEITEEQWPAKHLPEIIIADRGEFEGYSPENLINNLNIKIENTSPYRGDLKPIVERRFGIVNGKIKHTTPGAIQKEFRERGDRNYVLDATLSLKEFTELYINLVLRYNRKIIEDYPMEKEMIADQLVPKPILLWNWGIENKKGRLKTVSTDILRLNLLPRGNAGLSRAGIKFKGLFYSSDKAVKEQWFIKPKTNSISIVYDPRNIDTIYIPHDNGLGYDECYLLDKSAQYKGSMLEEVIFDNELLAELKKESIREQNQLDINLENNINDIIKRAKKEKQNAAVSGESENKQIKGIKENRKSEKEQNRIQEAFILGKNKTATESSVIKLSNIREEPDRESSSKNKIMEMLKKKRDEQREK